MHNIIINRRFSAITHVNPVAGVVQAVGHARLYDHFDGNMNGKTAH